MRMCLNRNVLVALGVTGLAVFLLAPSVFAATYPILILAACPLAMVVMMRAMGPQDGSGAGSRGGPAEETALTESAVGAAPTDSLTPPAMAGDGRPVTREGIESELRDLDARRRALSARLDSVDAQATGAPHDAVGPA